MVVLLAVWLLGIQMGSGQDATILQPPAVVLQVTMPSGPSRWRLPPGRRPPTIHPGSAAWSAVPR